MMKCPKCKEKTLVYFDGAFFKCHKCGFKEQLKDNYKELKEKWNVGKIG